MRILREGEAKDRATGRDGRDGRKNAAFGTFRAPIFLRQQPGQEGLERVFPARTVVLRMSSILHRLLRGRLCGLLLDSPALLVATTNYTYNDEGQITNLHYF